MDPMEVEYIMVLPHLMNVYGHQPCSINIPTDVIERCDSSFDIHNYSQFSLIRAILVIRACGGRYKRAYKTLEEIGIPVPIVVYVVKKICKILGCGNLDTNIATNDTIRAYDQFLHLQHPDAGYQQGNPHHQWGNQSHNASMEYIPSSPYGNPAHHMSGYGYDEYESVGPASPIHSHPGSHNNSFHIPNRPNEIQAMGLNPNAAAFSYPSPYEPSPSRQHHDMMSSPYHHYPRQEDMSPHQSFHIPSSPHHNQQHQHHPQQHPSPMNHPYPPEFPPELSYDRELSPSNIFIPSRPVDIHIHILQLLLPEVNIDALLERDVANINNNHRNPQNKPHNGRPHQQQQQSVAFQPVDLQSISQMFWILSICVFITVCDDRQPIEESLARLHELCQFVGSGNADLLTMSPVLGVALDVIVQRAVYELSDKVSLLPSKEASSSLSSTSSNVTTHDDMSPSIIPEPNSTPSSSSSGDGYSDPNMLYEAIHSHSVHAADLYRCISIMLHSVTDSCVRIESSFLPPSSSSYDPSLSSASSGMNEIRSSSTPTPPLSRSNSRQLGNMSSSTLPTSSSSSSQPQAQTSMNSRTQKLAKQLREALAWSSCRDQLPVESYTAYMNMKQPSSSSSSSRANSNDQHDDDPSNTLSSSASSSSSPEEMLSLKYQLADQILIGMMNPSSSSSSSSRFNQDHLYQDVDTMRNRLFSLFYHTSSSTSDFQDAAVDLGGLSGTNLLPTLIQLSSSSSSSGNNRSSSNMNQYRSSSSSLLSSPSSNQLSSSGNNSSSGPYYGDVEYSLNIPSFNHKIQSYRTSSLAIQNKLNVYHDILRIDATIENCLKHIKACIKEARNQMSSYWNDLQSYTQTYMKKYHHHSSNNHHNSHQQRNGNISSSSSSSGMDMMASKIAKIRAEMESLCSIGDKLISIMGNNLRALRSTGIPNNRSSLSAASGSSSAYDIHNLPIISNDYDTLAKLPVLLQGRRYLIDELSKVSELETNDLKHHLKHLEALIRDHASLPMVKLIIRPKHPGIRYGPVSSSSSSYHTYIISINDNGLFDPLLQLSSLYTCYMNYDKSTSGKVRVYFASIIHFARAHALADPDAGTLSIEAWLLLGLHVLLYYDILPHLHHISSSSSSDISSCDNSHDHIDISSSCKRSIDDYTIINLLELFFRYFTEELDVLGSIITVRGKGSYIIPKHTWRVDPPILWRLCIEDPYERGYDNISRSNDLGATLTRPGQIQVFKALRRASYAIHAIIIRDIHDSEKYIKMLFHKDDLLSLSRMAGYTGASVINTPVYYPMLSWSSSIVSVWTSDASLHHVDHMISSSSASALSSAAVTRHSSHRELIPNHPHQHHILSSSPSSSSSIYPQPLHQSSSSVNNSHHSILDELLIESFGVMSVQKKPSSSTSSARPLSSYNNDVVDNIRVIEGEYVDSDDDDDHSNDDRNNIVPRSISHNNSHNNMMSANAPSIIVPPSNHHHGPPSPSSSFHQPHHQSSSYHQQPSSSSSYPSPHQSLGSIYDIQNQSPQRRPPPNPNHHQPSSYRSPMPRPGIGGNIGGGVAGIGIGNNDIYHGPYPSPNIASASYNGGNINNEYHNDYHQQQHHQSHHQPSSPNSSWRQPSSSGPSSSLSNHRSPMRDHDPAFIHQHNQHQQQHNRMIPPAPSYPPPHHHDNHQHHQQQHRPATSTPAPSPFTRQPSYNSNNEALSYPSPSSYHPPHPSPYQPYHHQPSSSSSSSSSMIASEYDHILDRISSDSHHLSNNQANMSSPSSFHMNISSSPASRTQTPSITSSLYGQPHHTNNDEHHIFSSSSSTLFDSPSHHHNNHHHQLSTPQRSSSSNNMMMTTPIGPSSSSMMSNNHHQPYPILSSSPSYDTISSPYQPQHQHASSPVASLFHPNNYLLSPEIDPTVAVMQGLMGDPSSSSYPSSSSSSSSSSFADEISDHLHAWLTESVASILPEGFMDTSPQNVNNINSIERKQLFK